MLNGFDFLSELLNDHSAKGNLQKLYFFMDEKKFC